MAGGAFFDSGFLANHSHSTTAGDGGQLSNPTIIGVMTEDGPATSAKNVPTLQQAQMLALAAAASSDGGS